MTTPQHPKLRVCAVQAAPVFLDLDGTVDKTIALMEQAQQKDVQLIAFPETWLPGYPWWIWLSAPALGMQYVQRYFDNSLVMDSTQFQRLADAARSLNMWLSFGCSERDGGSLYISQALIDNEGRTRMTRRKLKPTHAERTVFGEGSGSDLDVVQTSIGRIGMLNCWEHLQPLSKYALYAQNEQIHIAAWPSFSLYPGKAYALGPEVNTAASRIYAVEGSCFVLAPCNTVSPDMHALLCTDDVQRDLLYVGGGYARIYGPDGLELGTSLAPDEEGLVVADVDLGTISLAKAAADPAGHYARPDVTRLLLNKTPGDRVVSWAPPPASSMPAGNNAAAPAGPAPEPAQRTEGAQPAVMP